MAKQAIARGRSDDAVVAAHTIETAGYEVRCIAAGSDGVQRWVVHLPDSATGTGYNPRSYFSREQLIELAGLESKQELRAAIIAAQITRLSYINIKGETYMQKKSRNKKSGATAEKAAREARATKGSAVKAGKGTKVPAAKATKKATTNGNGKASGIDLSDPDVQLLAGYQEQTTTERMTAANMVNLFKRIKAATLDNPVANSGLNAYDKRQARELARLGLITKDKVEGVGLAYFAS
jgi:hypothetical protein